MLGYKFTIVQIQKAYIKQIIYSYLFNAFLVSPNVFYRNIMFDFSKDNLEKNSKDQFELFTNINKDLIEDFYSKLLEVDTKVLNYMHLALILNKDKQTNFDIINDENIRSLGEIELKNVFIDTLLDFLEKIKESYNINLDDLYYSEANSVDSRKTTIEEFFKTSGFIPTSNKVDTSSDDGLYLIPYLNITQKQISDFQKLTTVPAMDEYLLDKLTDGLRGEFYYKIKDKLQIKLNCGNNAKKDVIIVSYRANKDAIKNSKEFLGVQKYYDWKKDSSFEDLDQFIFYREPGLKNIFEHAANNDGLIKKQLKFSSIEYYGLKILNKNEILELKENLIKSGKDDGFIAIIPTETIKDGIVEDFNSRVLSLSNGSSYSFSIFSEKERKLKLSMDDVSRILSNKKNYFVPNENFSLYNDPSDNIYVTKTLQPYINSFSLDELFDVYFDIAYHEYELKEVPRESNLLFSKNNSKNFASGDELEKNGTFVLLVPKITETYSKVYGPNNLKTKLILLTRKTLLTVKLNEKIEKIFSGFEKPYEVSKEIKNSFVEQTGGKKTLINSEGEAPPMLSGLITGLGPSAKFVTFEKTNVVILSQNFYSKISNIASSNEYRDIIKIIFPDSYSVPKTTSIVDKIDFGTLNKNFNSIKNLRSYKNFKDFIIYYRDMISGLIQEEEDFV